MSGGDWLDGPPGRKGLARAALADTVATWLSEDGLSVEQVDVTRISPAGGSSCGWDEVLRATVDAAAIVARYSELARGGEAVNKERLVQRADAAARTLRRLAELVVIELRVVVDWGSVIDEAGRFVDEVEAEDDGLWHAADAIGSLLQARLICAEDGIELPRAELERSGVAILAPLVAQAACLRWP